MNITKNPDDRAIPAYPGGGSWTFDDVQWAWISNDPIPAEAPAAAVQADAGNELATAPAAQQE